MVVRKSHPSPRIFHTTTEPQPHHNHTTPEIEVTDVIKFWQGFFGSIVAHSESTLRQTFIHWRIYAVPGITLKPCIPMWSISILVVPQKCDEMGDTP